MKMKTLLLTLLAGTILSSNVLNAEDGVATNTKNNTALGKKPASSETPKNVVKLNLFPFALMSVGLKNFSLQYERAVGKKISVGLGLSFMPASRLPTKFTEGSPLLVSLRTKGYALTPEFRFYPGKKGAPRGFYLAPYLRYSSYTMSTGYNYTKVDTIQTYPVVTQSTTYNVDAKGKYTFIGGGVMIGVHYMIKNRVSIDWGIFGLHAGASKISLSASSPSMFGLFSDKDRAQIQAELNDSFGNMPGNSSVDVTNTGFTVEWKPPFSGGIRSIVGGWLTIGVAF